MPTDSWWHPFQQVQKEMNIIVEILNEKKRDHWILWFTYIFMTSACHWLRGDKYLYLFPLLFESFYLEDFRHCRSILEFSVVNYIALNQTMLDFVESCSFFDVLTRNLRNP